MKAREQRRSMMVGARMRVGASWGDVCILDASSRGLGLHSSNGPPTGSYVELRRGPYVIVARVVWSNGERFGVSTQDRIAIDAILGHRPPPPSEPSASAPVERRAAPRRTNLGSFERSRMLARGAEFAFIAFAGASAATAGYALVGHALAKPLATVSARLAGK